jgi:hypothetical protein
LFGTRCEISHQRELTRAEVEALMRNAGARVMECRALDSLIQPAGKLGATLAHLVGDRPKWRGRLARLWAWAGYQTLFYAATRL